MRIEQSSLAVNEAGASGATRAVARPQERETPPGWNPAARCKRELRESGFQRVGALPVLSLRGYYGQAHFLSEGAADEAPYGMRLPVRGFHDLLQRGSFRPFQQIDPLRG